jgi:hypothetical protein
MKLKLKIVFLRDWRVFDDLYHSSDNPILYTLNLSLIDSRDYKSYKDPVTLNSIDPLRNLDGND